MSAAPPGWVQSTVGALLSVRYGKATPRTDDGPVPVVASAGTIRHTVEGLTHGQTLVVGRKGGIGRVHLVSGPVWPTDTTYYISVPEPLSAKFLYYQMLSLGLERLDRSTAVPSLQRQDLESASLCIAPQAEQERIVAAIEEQLSRVDAGVAALERVRQNLKHIRASVLQSAVTGNLAVSASTEPFPEVSEVGTSLATRLTGENLRKVTRASADLCNKTWRVPPAWRWQPAAEVCEVITSGSTPPQTSMSSGHGDVPYIKVYNLTHRGALDFTVRPTFIDRATHTGRLARSRLLPGDVLTNIVGPPLGKVSVVPPDYPEWNTNQAVVLFRPMRQLHPRLLKYWLMSPPILGLLESTSRATAGQFNVSLTTCRALPLPIPPRSEQEAIVKTIEQCLSTIDLQDDVLAAALARSNRLRSSILAAAFRGELAPQDPTDEPAADLLERIASERAVFNGHRSPGPRVQRKKVTA